MYGLARSPAPSERTGSRALGDLPLRICTDFGTVRQVAIAPFPSHLFAPLTRGAIEDLHKKALTRAIRISVPAGPGMSGARDLLTTPEATRPAMRTPARPSPATRPEAARTPGCASSPPAR